MRRRMREGWRGERKDGEEKGKFWKHLQRPEILSVAGGHDEAPRSQAQYYGGRVASRRALAGQRRRLDAGAVSARLVARPSGGYALYHVTRNLLPTSLCSILSQFSFVSMWTPAPCDRSDDVAMMVSFLDPTTAEYAVSSAITNALGAPVACIDPSTNAVGSSKADECVEIRSGGWRWHVPLHGALLDGETMSPAAEAAHRQRLIRTGTARLHRGHHCVYSHLSVWTGSTDLSMPLVHCSRSGTGVRSGSHGAYPFTQSNVSSSTAQH